MGAGLTKCKGERPAAPAPVPTDTIVPLTESDDTNYNRALILLLMLRFDDVLDVARLRSSLEELVTDHWPKLGARLRLNSEGRLEYHIPARFGADRPPVTFTHARHDGVRIGEHPLGSALPRPPPSPPPTSPTPTPPISPTSSASASVSASTSPSNHDTRSTAHRDAAAFGDGLQQPIVFEGDPTEAGLALMRGSGGGGCSSPGSIDEYCATDAPQLGCHVESFADATLVSLSWPHTLCDVPGIREVLSAWGSLLSASSSSSSSVGGQQAAAAASASAVGYQGGCQASAGSGGGGAGVVPPLWPAWEDPLEEFDRGVKGGGGRGIGRDEARARGAKEVVEEKEAAAEEREVGDDDEGEGGEEEEEEEHVMADKALSFAQTAWFALRLAWDLARNPEEEARMVCIPAAHMRRLKDEAMADLAESAGGEDNGSTFVSDGDLLAAIALRCAVRHKAADSPPYSSSSCPSLPPSPPPSSSSSSSGSSPKPSASPASQRDQRLKQQQQTVSLVAARGLRDELAACGALPSSAAYLGNAVTSLVCLTTVREILGYPTTTPTTTPTPPPETEEEEKKKGGGQQQQQRRGTGGLARVAAGVRRAVALQGTLPQLRARRAAERRAARAAMPVLHGDGGMHLVVMSNWAKAGLFETDFSAAVVDGGGGEGEGEGETKGERNGQQQGEEVRGEGGGGGGRGKGGRGRPSYVQGGKVRKAVPFRSSCVVLGKDGTGNYWLQIRVRKGHAGNIRKIIGESFGSVSGGEREGRTPGAAGSECV